MSNPVLAVLVRFHSALSMEEINEVIHSRIEEFRALEGLEQKYYLRNEATGEVAGLYLWRSEEDFTAYLNSALRASIAEAYQTEGEPRVELFHIQETLRSR